jgi:hypothetical protein
MNQSNLPNNSRAISSEPAKNHQLSSSKRTQPINERFESLKMTLTNQKDQFKISNTIENSIYRNIIKVKENDEFKLFNPSNKHANPRNG